MAKCKTKEQKEIEMKVYFIKNISLNLSLLSSGFL